MMYNLYSIGHGNKEIVEFISNLKKFQIELLVDVRTIPYSSNFPQYNQKELSKKLKENSINYLFFGDKLGGRPKIGFSNFLDTQDFKQNIGKLLLQVKNKNTVIMCSEFNYVYCHRRFINEILRKNGIYIKNIDKYGEIVKEEQFTINTIKK